MKRELKSQSKKAEKEILARNSEFYDDTIRQYYPEKKTAKFNRRLIIKVSSIVTACVLFVACLSVVLYSILNDNKIEYLYENEVVEDCDLTELQNAVPWFPKFNEQEYEQQISRTYDSLSGDNLYFVVEIKDANFAETIKIYLYINPRYKHDKKMLTNAKNANINGLDIIYNENISSDADDFYTFEYKAQYNHGKNEVYIEYRQLWFENDSHFFEFLEEIVF